LRNPQSQSTAKSRGFSATRVASEVPLALAEKPEEYRMLKIHRSAEGGETIFTLSGRMDDESTAELESLIRAEAKGQRIALDIGDLTLVGQRDIDFLVRCEGAGIKLMKCARYVRDWIAKQRSADSRGDIRP
jgi:hypothetical protein